MTDPMTRSDVRHLLTFGVGARLLVAVLAVAMIVFGLTGLSRSSHGVAKTVMDVEGTPATLFSPVGAERTRLPVLVIAHGFAGSQPLMRGFAETAARNGMLAITFDFLGHGLNPAPLTGSITAIDGATMALVRQTEAVVRKARDFGDGRVALLGHSMASDIVIRVANRLADITATVAISAFSQAVTPASPRNLLLVAGSLEGFLTEEALAIVGQVAAPASPQAGVTYGSLTNGTARRFATAPHVEHVGVLFSATTLDETQRWLSGALGFAVRDPDVVPIGGAVVALLTGLILAAWPLIALVPVVSTSAAGAGLPWARLWIAIGVPALVTPLALRVLPTGFLPVLVADYLICHFALQGVLSIVILTALGRPPTLPPGPMRARFPVALVLAVLLTVLPLLIALDATVASLWPVWARLPLFLTLFAASLVFWLAVEWTVRGPGTGRGASVAIKVAFLLSLSLAVALDFERLFFLAIIVPVIVPFLMVFGLIARWLHARTGHPAIGATANAVAFALAIGATFPMLGR